MRRGHTREDYEMHKDGGRNPWSVAGICRGNDDDDEFSVADIDQEDGLGPGLVSSSKTASTIEAPSEVVPMSSTAEVDARRAANEASRRPAVRSVWLSTYGGLGYQQSRLGDAMFTCVRHDAAAPLAALLAPLHWRVRAVVPAAAATVLFLVRFLAWVLEPPEDTLNTAAAAMAEAAAATDDGSRLGSGSGGSGSSNNNSSSSGVGGEAIFWIGAALVLFLATLCALAMPDSGVTASYRDEWDRTPLHHAAMHRAPQCATVLMQHATTRAKTELFRDQQQKMSRGGSYFWRTRHKNITVDDNYGNSSSVSSTTRMCAVHGFRPLPSTLLPSNAKSQEPKPVESFVDAQDWALATPLHLAAAAGDAHLCAILLDLPSPPHAAAAAAAGGGFGSSVDTHHQEQQHRHLLRLPSTWGARSRGWFDATNRRPYELVPEPSLVLNVGVGDTGGRIGVGESGIGTDAGLDKARKRRGASRDRGATPGGKGRRAPDFIPPPPLPRGWNRSDDDDDEDMRTHRRDDIGKKLTFNEAWQLKLTLGAPSGQVGTWLAHELFPLLRSSRSSQVSHGSGSGGVTGTAVTAAAGSIALRLPAILEQEVKRARADMEPGLAAHLRDAALNAPVISIPSHGQLQGKEEEDGIAHLTPLGLAIVALAEALADGASSTVDNHSTANAAGFLLQPTPAAPAPAVPNPNFSMADARARGATARAAIGCLLALGANPAATDSIGRSALALSKLVGLQRCDSSLYHRLETAAAAASYTSSSVSGLAATSSTMSVERTTEAATTTTTSAAAPPLSSQPLPDLDSSPVLTAAEASAARAEAAAIAKHFSVRPAAAAADVTGPISSPRLESRHRDSVRVTEEAESGGEFGVFCSPCGQQPLPTFARY